MRSKFTRESFKGANHTMRREYGLVEVMGFKEFVRKEEK